MDLTWILQQKIVATGLNARNSYDGFGRSVDISGETLVVGAYNHAYDPTGANPATASGAVFIYTRSAGVWTQQQKIIATGVNSRFSFDYLGYSVSISGDTLAASSNNAFDATGANFLSDAGAVFVYTRTAGVWSQQQKIVATGLNARQNGDTFGASLDLNGDTIVIGSPVHVYDATGADPLAYAGAVFVFTRSAGIWSLEQKIVPTGLNARGIFESFGNKVTLQGDTLVATSSNAYDDNGFASQPGYGAAYVFTRAAGVWTQQQKIVPSGLNSRVAGNEFGRSISLDGDSLAVGALNSYDAYGEAELTDAGATYIFNRVAGVWSQSLRLTPLGAKDRMTGDKFGDAVCLHEDPVNKTFTLGIGAPEQAYSSTGTDPITKAGAVYIYH